MPQHIRDFFERRSLAQHASGRSVAQDVRPFRGGVDPRLFEGLADDMPNRTGRDWGAQRGEMANEDETLLGFRTALTEIVLDGLSDFAWQGKKACSVGFTRGHQEGPQSPIDILEREAGHFPCTQCHLCHTQRHGSTAQATRCGTIKTREQCVQLLLGETAGQGAETMMGDRGNGTDELRLTEALELQESKEASQSAGDPLGGLCLTVSGSVGDELDQIRCS